jgi:diacylglycerol kinase family enzyme
MTQPVTVASVIINQSSGANQSGGSQACDRLRREIEDAFTAQNVRVQWLPLSRRDLARSRERALEQLVLRAEGLVVAAGGDGTVNAVATACRKFHRPFGILPTGTFNYIARNLGLPLDISEAAKVITAGHAAPIQAGEINGKLFLNNAGFGLYSQMVERREIAKRRYGRHRLVAFVSGIRCLLGRHPVYDLHITADGKEHSLRTTTLFFGVNALQLQNYQVELAKYVQAGKLAVLSLRLDSRLDIAQMAWAALHDKVEAADCVDGTAANSVRVTTRRRELKVAIDGEIVVLKAPLAVRVVHDGLTVMLPPPQPEQEAEEPREEERAALPPAPELSAN